jgi:hypothetical protein
MLFRCVEPLCLFIHDSLFVLEPLCLFIHDSFFYVGSIYVVYVDGCEYGRVDKKGQ